MCMPGLLGGCRSFPGPLVEQMLEVNIKVKQMIPRNTSRWDTPWPSGWSCVGSVKCVGRHTTGTKVHAAQPAT